MTKKLESVVFLKRNLLHFFCRKGFFSIVYFLFLIGIIKLDLKIKGQIKKNLKPGEKKEFISETLFLWRTENKGIAFNGLEKNPRLVLALSGSLIAGIMVWFFHMLTQTGQTGKKIGLLFLLGGALGNFCDRLQNGSVTDYIFIKKKNAPVFNLADVFVVLGGFLVLIFSGLQDKK